MAGFRQKILVFAMAVALGGVVLVICSAQSATNGMESGEARPVTNQPQVNTESKNDPLSIGDPNLFGRPDYNPAGWEYLVKAVLAILFVLALFVAAIYTSKKLLPRISNLAGKEIRIVETIHLGPRKAVHLLEIDNRRFLIGSTNESITKLADLSGNIMDMSPNEVNYN